MSDNPEPSQHGGSFAPFWSLLKWGSVVVAVYLLPLLLIVVDEFVLRSNWFSRHLPPFFGDLFRALYPFMRILGD